MIPIAYRYAFDGLTFSFFTVKNILVVVATMINPFLIESSKFFYQSVLLIYVKIFIPSYR